MDDRHDFDALHSGEPGVESLLAVALTERLLDGGHGDPVLAGVVDALRAPGYPGELEGIDEAVRSMRAEMSGASGSRSEVDRLERPARAGAARPRAVAVAAMVALMAMTGVAGAATGSLPDAIQSDVARVLERVGLSVPSPGDTDTGSEEVDEATFDEGDPETPHAEGESGTLPGESEAAESSPGWCVKREIRDAADESRPVGEAARAATRDCDPPGADHTDSSTPAVPATPAAPATPVVPATPADPGSPATPATPAVPASPAGVGSPTVADPPSTRPQDVGTTAATPVPAADGRSGANPNAGRP